MLFNISNIRKNNTKTSKSEKQKVSDKPVLQVEDSCKQALITCKKRMNYGILGFIIVYLAIVIKVFCLCTANGIVIREETTEEQKTTNTVLSRADIIDRNGTIIATSLPTVNLQVSPKFKIKNAEEVATELSYIFPDLKYENILANLLKQKNNQIKINLSPAQQAEVNSLGIPALEFVSNQARVYPQDNLFSHILGYTDIDNIGIRGIEKSMHERITQSTKPLQLTVDTTIQDVVREELIKAQKKYSAIGATAILMDVNNGEIIAMVSLPDYNPNLDKSSTAQFNFATQGVYEAGSVFKTFNTALGLESKKIKTTDKFDTTKPLKLNGVNVRDTHPVKHWMDVGEILVESSNIGSVQIVTRVGREKQREFLANLGFSEKLTDFEIYEKGTPLFPSKEKWLDHTMITASYGYGLSVTPLHLISAFNSLVNGGIYYYPKIIKSTQTKAPRRIISESTSQKMIPLLRDVVAKSSTKAADVKGYQVIGKTGTAEKLVNGKYSKKNIASFLSAFPASSPKYSLLVILDEPQGIPETYNLRYAGWNAAPTAGNIIKAIAPQLNIQADFNIEEQRKHVKAAFEK